jgi:hydrogenase expression/formation protein HypC
MCLAIPGLVLSVEAGDGELRTSKVDFCGIEREVSLAFTPEVVPGDYVLVHAGFALNRIDAEEAARTLADFKELGALGEEAP